MMTKKLGFILAVPLLLLTMASSTYADISNAAVLFLRIAPGARAAGMGEAFVAVADDATTTHWNPAGLGAYPLADGWTVADVPTHLRPLEAIAAVKRDEGSDFKAYEIWATSAQGLVRYDNRSWNTGEVFGTRTDQTVREIVASYFKVQDNALLDLMVARVARANADGSREQLVQFRDSLLEQVPEDYRDREFLSERLDTLLSAYDKVRIRWDVLNEARKNYRDALKDGELDNEEVARIQVGIERARMRFIPEEITIPYSVLFEGSPTAIAAKGRLLVVGTPNGLFTYDGRSWRTFTEEDGLPSADIRALYASGSLFYVGTANGLVMFGGRDITTVDGTDQLPEGPVRAIGADGLTRLWVVIGDRLFRYNGTGWSSGRAYTIGVDETLEDIAEKFTIYGTEAEKAAFIEYIKELNVNGPVDETEVETAEAPAPTDENEILDIAQIGEMLEAESDGTTAADTTMAEAEADTTAEMAIEDAAEPVEVDWNNLPPGDVIFVPYAVSIKGDVNTMLVRLDELYIGTDYGLLFYDGETWRMPGYREYTIGEEDTFAAIVGMAPMPPSADAKMYAEGLIAINDLDTNAVETGKSIQVYRNAVAAEINQIRKSGAMIYIATSAGMRVWTGSQLERVTEKGMDRADAIYMDAIEDELWMASSDQIVIKANGRMEFSLMHVNWLPELADDMYYEFLSAVFQGGDIGTFGVNVTYLTYGSIARTTNSSDPVGTFEPYDIAVTGAWGFSLNQKLKAGIAAKIIYSRLSNQGAGVEKGKGTSTGLAGDIGLLYQHSPKLNIGLAVTNLGPDMAYIDAAQSDPLPRNLAFGFAYKILNSDYTSLLLTLEANKLLVGVDDGFGTELEEVIANIGAEFVYADLLAVRGGYIHDEEGRVKTLTLGAGLKPLEWMRADFSYIPNSDDVALANTLRMSLSIRP